MLARVVTFDGVSSDRMNQMRQEMQDGQPPEGLEPEELLVLHDPDWGKSAVVVVIADGDADRRGAEILSNMGAAATPAQRTAAGRYDVARRMKPKGRRGPSQRGSPPYRSLPTKPESR